MKLSDVMVSIPAGEGEAKISFLLTDDHYITHMSITGAEAHAAEKFFKEAFEFMEKIQGRK